MILYHTYLTICFVTTLNLLLLCLNVVFLFYSFLVITVCLFQLYCQEKTVVFIKLNLLHKQFIGICGVRKLLKIWKMSIFAILLKKVRSQAGNWNQILIQRNRIVLVRNELDSRNKNNNFIFSNSLSTEG